MGNCFSLTLLPHFPKNVIDNIVEEETAEATVVHQGILKEVTRGPKIDRGVVDVELMDDNKTGNADEDNDQQTDPETSSAKLGNAGTMTLDHADKNEKCTTTVATITATAKLDQLVVDLMGNDPERTVLEATDLFSSRADQIYSALSESERRYTKTYVSTLFISVQHIAQRDIQLELALGRNNKSQFFQYIRSSKALRMISFQLIAWHHSCYLQFVQEILNAMLQNPQIHVLGARNAFQSPAALTDYIDLSWTQLTSMELVLPDAFQQYSQQECDMAVDAICLKANNLHTLCLGDFSRMCYTVPILQKLHHHKKLVELDLSTPFHDCAAFVPALAHYVSTTTTLQRLILSLHNWDGELLRLVIDALRINQSICRLGLHSCHFDVASTAMFFSYLPTNDTIREMSVRGLGDTFKFAGRGTVGTEFARALDASVVEVIEFGNNSWDTFYEAIGLQDSWNKSKDKTDTEDIAPFFDHVTLSSSTPTTLQRRQHRPRLEYHGMAALLRFLPTSVRPEELMVDDDAPLLDHTAADTSATSEPHTLQRRLRRLRFDYLGYHGMKALLRFLPTTVKLQELVVDDVPDQCCSSTMAKAMIHAFRLNGSCRYVRIKHHKQSLLARPEFRCIESFVIRNNATIVGPKLLNDPNNTDISLLPSLLFVLQQASQAKTYRSTMICLHSMLGRGVGPQNNNNNGVSM